MSKRRRGESCSSLSLWPLDAWVLLEHALPDRGRKPPFLAEAEVRLHWPRDYFDIYRVTVQCNGVCFYECFDCLRGTFMNIHYRYRLVFSCDPAISLFVHARRTSILFLTLSTICSIYRYTHIQLPEYSIQLFPSYFQLFSF